MKRTIISASLGLLLFGFATVVGSTSESEIGAASFIHFGVDARSLGMGGASVSLAEGFSAIYWNPAGLAQEAPPQIGGTSLDLYGADINFTFIGAYLPLNSLIQRMSVRNISLSRRLGLGMALMEVATEVHAFDPSGQPIGLIRYTEDCFNFGIGYAVTDYGYLGLVLKGYLFKAPKAGVNGKTAWAMGIGADVGFLLKFQDIRLGIKISDVGDTNIKWYNTPTEPTDNVLCHYHVGISYHFNELDLGVTYEFTCKEPGRGVIKTGAEYTIKFLKLRAGFVKPLNSTWYLTAGMGVSFKKMEFDVAWVQNKALKVEGATDTIVLSATLSF